MKQNEIQALLKTYHGLAHALEDAFGKRIPLDAVSAEPVQPIDTRFLATILEEYHEVEGSNYSDEPDLTRYQIPSLYIVWDDGLIEKSDQIDYRCVGTTYDGWSGEILCSGDISHEPEEAKPIGSHFVSKANVKHVILLESRSSRLDGEQKKIEAISIKIFVPHEDTNITATSQKIMEIWETYGSQELDHYLLDLLFPDEWED